MLYTSMAGGMMLPTFPQILETMLIAEASSIISYSPANVYGACLQRDRGELRGSAVAKREQRRQWQKRRTSYVWSKENSGLLEGRCVLKREVAHLTCPIILENH
jgi:hypothetical protein